MTGDIWWARKGETNRNVIFLKEKYNYIILWQYNNSYKLIYNKSIDVEENWSNKILISTKKKMHEGR